MHNRQTLYSATPLPITFCFETESYCATEPGFSSLLPRQVSNLWCPQPRPLTAGTTDWPAPSGLEKASLRPLVFQRPLLSDVTFTFTLSLQDSYIRAVQSSVIHSLWPLWSLAFHYFSPVPMRQLLLLCFQVDWQSLVLSISWVAFIPETVKARVGVAIVF